MTREARIRELRLLKELRVRRALRDPLFWLQECTQTKDEQDNDNPYKPFPEKPYFAPIIDLLDREPVVFLEKSRTMMLSWLISGWLAHKMFNNPAYGVVIQSEDEDRAVHCIANIKCLWERSDPELRKRWPLERDLAKQPYNKFFLKNGSWAWGIPGDPNKSRSVHPAAIFFDEAAFMRQFLQAYNIAIASRTPKMICNSSAEVGAFRDVTRSAKACDWIWTPAADADDAVGQLDQPEPELLAV